MKSKLPVHLEYLTYTVDKIINFLKETSQSSHNQTFLNIVQTAKNDYMKPQENFITGFIFKKSRIREQDVENFIENWNKNLKNLRIKLWDFNELIRKGGWDDGSYFTSYEGSFNIALMEGMLNYLKIKFPQGSSDRVFFFKDLKEALQCKIDAEVLDFENEEHQSIAEGCLELLSDFSEESVFKVHMIIHAIEKAVPPHSSAPKWLQAFQKSNNAWERMGVLSTLIVSDQKEIQNLKRKFFKETLNELLPQYLLDKNDETWILNNIISFIKNVLPQHIQALEFDRKNCQARKDEVEKIAIDIRKKVDFVHVYSDEAIAIFNAYNKPQLAVFCLRPNPAWEKTTAENYVAPDKWHLFWIDPAGKLVQLRADNKLVDLLRNSRQLADCNLAKMPAIQSQCLEIRNVFLNKYKIETNPVDEKAVLYSTFQLKRNASHCELIWHNQTGKKLEIDLSKYKLLQDWLAKQVNWYEDTDQIFKCFLPAIETRTKLVCESEHLAKLEAQFAVKGAQPKNMTKPKPARSIVKSDITSQPLASMFFKPPVLEPKTVPEFNYSAASNPTQ